MENGVGPPSGASVLMLPNSPATQPPSRSAPLPDVLDDAEATEIRGSLQAPESGVVGNMRVMVGAPMAGGESQFAVEPGKSP